MDHINSAGEAADDDGLCGQRADNILVRAGKARHKNEKARLDAELLHEGFSRIARSILLFEHDLLGKPVSTFPDHARRHHACGCGSSPASGSGRGRGLPAGGTAEVRGPVGSSTDSRFGFLPLMTSVISSPVSVSYSR